LCGRFFSRRWENPIGQENSESENGTRRLKRGAHDHRWRGFGDAGKLQIAARGLNSLPRFNHLGVRRGISKERESVPSLHVGRNEWPGPEGDQSRASYAGVLNTGWIPRFAVFTRSHTGGRRKWDANRCWGGKTVCLAWFIGSFLRGDRKRWLGGWMGRVMPNVGILQSRKSKKGKSGNFAVGVFGPLKSKRWCFSDCLSVPGPPTFFCRGLGVIVGAGPGFLCGGPTPGFRSVSV